MGKVLLCGRFELKLDRPLIMGVINVTPDSFSDGSRHFETDAAVAHARTLLEEGADILDIGGESTRPGAREVPESEELRRVLPVLEALRGADIPLSVDTFKPGVMRAVLNAGADMINDIYAFRRPGALEAVQASRCGLCAMHMQGDPRTMQIAPAYDDVVAELRAFFVDRVETLRHAGVSLDRLVLDPGFGFGKTVKQNYILLHALSRLKVDALPLVVGVSRKSMIGQVTGRPASQRLAGSISAALAAVSRGAAIVRVHDVAATVDAMRVWRAVEEGACDESA